MNQIIKSQFVIKPSVVKDILKVTSDQLQQQLLKCTNVQQGIYLLQNLEQINNSSQLRARIYSLYVISDSENMCSRICLPEILALIKQYRIQYDGSKEFYIYEVLAAYLTCKQCELHEKRDSFKELFKLMQYKPEFLHIIIRCIIGYVLIIKISKTSKFAQIFAQVNKIIVNVMELRRNVSFYKEDIYLFIYYWRLSKKQHSDAELKDIRKTIQLAQSYYQDNLTFQSLLQSIDQMLADNEKQRLIQKQQQVTDESRLFFEQTQISIPKFKANNPARQLKKSFIVQGKYYSASQRIQSTPDLTYRSTTRYTNVDQDPILQLQMENYHINKLVKQGYFRLPTNLSDAKDTRQTRIVQTQPSQLEATLLIDEVVEDSPIQQRKPTTQTIKVQILDVPLSPREATKHSSHHNPFKLRNLISSRFQQILSLGQQSENGTPVNKKPQQVEQQMPQYLTTQRQSVNFPQQARRSGVLLDPSRSSFMMNLQSEQQSLSSSKLEKSEELDVPRQRRRLVIMQTIEHVSIPSVNFVAKLNGRVTHWMMRVEGEQGNSVLYVQETVHHRIIYTVRLDKQIKSWNSVMEALNIESTDVSQLKNSFIGLLRTHLQLHIRETGSILIRQTYNDQSLQFGRELLLVIRFYRQKLINSFNRDKTYELIQTNLKETLHHNIKLLNGLLRMRVLQQKKGQYLVHKQIMQGSQLNQALGNQFMIVTVYITLPFENVIHRHKNSLHVQDLTVIYGSKNITPLSLSMISMLKIMNIVDIQEYITRILYGILFQTDIHRIFMQFASTHLMINEQKQMAIKMNIFSLKDAQRLESCGMRMGFSLDLNVKQQPFAITELERFLNNNQQQISQVQEDREHMFDNHFNKIFSTEIQEQKRKSHNLSDLLRRYQPVYRDEPEKAGEIVVQQDNPFADIHMDDYETITIKSQKRSQFVYLRSGQNQMFISITNVIVAKFNRFNRMQKVQTSISDINQISSALRNAPTQTLQHMIYQKLSQKTMNNSFLNILSFNGYSARTQLKARSGISEIPPYYVLHDQLLNNPQSLLKYFNRRSFILLDRIQNYGIHNIIIQIFQRNEELLFRVDFIKMNAKVGQSKIIFNRHDIEEVLKIPMQDDHVQLVKSVLSRMYVGLSNVRNRPYFLQSQPDELMIYRRISNDCDNSTFKKATDLQKGFLETHIQNHRLILTHVKKFYLICHSLHGHILKISNKPEILASDQIQNLEMCLVQVFRHLLIDNWLIKIYVPRTTRLMSAVVTQGDFAELNTNIFAGINIQKKPKITRSTSIQIKKHSDNLSKFFYLTTLVSQGKTERFLEAQIWRTILDSTELESQSKQSHATLSLKLGEKELPLQELLYQKYIRIERVGESHIEFYMKYAQKDVKGFAIIKGKLGLLKGPKFMNLVSDIKYTEDQTKYIKRQSIFFAFDPINYANTSNFNIEIKYFSYNKLTEIKEQINLRELLNLYIADGYYKYQTNYMNSKLNHSDILNICQYMIHKIKTQNFLNLSQYHLIPNLTQMKSRSEVLDPTWKIYDDFLFKISILQDEVKIVKFDHRTCRQSQYVFSIEQIDDYILGFKAMVISSAPVALSKIAKIAKYLMSVNGL